MSNKRRQQEVSKEEQLKELIREANGASKDMMQQISLAREILPGLKEQLITEGIVKRIDDELDKRFEVIMNKKVNEVSFHLSKMIDQAERDILEAYSIMVTVLSRALPVIQESPLFETMTVTELADILAGILNEYKYPINTNKDNEDQ